MTLRIYGIARTRAFRALWTANELGIEYEHLPIEIRSANPEAQDYLKINPNGRLPAIVDDNFVLWESLAITMYLAKKHANGTLYPGSLEGEAKTWQWALWAVTEVDRGFNIYSLHADRLPPAERNPVALAEALRVLEQPLRALNKELADRPYLIGDTFTIADLNAAAVMSRGRHMDFTATPRVGEWLERCLERPAARKTLALRDAADAATPDEVTRMIVARNRL